MRWSLPVPCWTIPFFLCRRLCRAALVVRDDPGVQQRSFLLLALHADSTVCFGPPWKSLKSMKHLRVPFGCLYSLALMQPSYMALIGDQGAGR